MKQPIEINIEAEPGHTPIKGVDYWTTEDQSQIISEIMSHIVIPDPIPGKDAEPVDYSKIEEFVKREVSNIQIPEVQDQTPIDVNSIIVSVLEQIPKQEEIVIDYPGIKEFCSKEIERLLSDQSNRYRQLNSGGPTTRLGELVDVSVDNIQTGQVLSWNGTNWVAKGDTDAQDLQSVTDIGNTTTNTISVAGLDVGDSTHVAVAGEAYFEDTDIIFNGGSINNVNAIQFNTTATPLPNAEGLLQWNLTDGTADLGMRNGTITQQIGQELFTKVKNDVGSQINNGQVVYISGRTGVFPDVKLARADAESTSRVLGVSTEDIPFTGDKFGYVTTVGYVRGIKTDYTGIGNWGTTWATGDMLYVSKTVAGQLTNIEPTAPHHSDIVGSVGVVSATQGSILVNIDRHKTLEELTDVNGTPLTATGQFPSWNQTSGYFDFDKNINDYLKLDQTTPQSVSGVLDINTPVENAIIIGDVTGDTRGSYSVDIQSYRSDSTRVASGNSSNAIGYDNTAAGVYSNAMGSLNYAGIRGQAFGWLNEASGSSRATAFGVSNSALGRYSTAFGVSNYVQQDNSTSFGLNNQVYGTGNVTGSNNTMTETSFYSLIAGESCTVSGNYSGSFGYKNISTGNNTYTLGSKLLSVSSGNFKMGTDTFALTLNNTGLSFQNENALTKLHSTGKVLVTDVGQLGTELSSALSTGWTYGAGWRYGSAFAEKYTDGTGTMSKTMSITAGKYYYVQITMARIDSGTFKVTLGGADSEVFNSGSGSEVNVWRGVFKAVTTGGLIITPFETTSRWAYISAISVKEITGGDVEALGAILGASAKIGSSTNYTNFDSTGHQTMVGTAQPWDDLRVEPIVKQAAGVGVPAFEKYFDDAAGTSKGVYLYSFTDESVAGNEKEIFFTAQMPHSWNGGEIKVHVHFVPSATVNSSDIIWGLEYAMKEPTATFGDTTIITSSTTLVPNDANITAGKHYIATFSGITPDTTQDDLSTILICRLFRNSSSGSDTYTNKAGLLYVDIHYQMARIGSNDEYTA